MIHYVCRNVAVGGESELLDMFFDEASDELRQHALEFVGRWVRDDRGELGADDLGHLVALWESRYSAAASVDRPNAAFSRELSAFGWWFASGRFEDRWALEQLRNVLVLIKHVDAGWLVVERLSKVAEEFPREAVSCLRVLIDADAQEWGMLGADDGVSDILRKALASGVPNAASEARSLIHHLGSMNRREYRSLLDT